MGRLFGMFGSLFVYLCVGTVIALMIILGYAATHGYLDKDKLARMADVARGIEVAAVPAEQAKKEVESPDQPSFDDIERRRGIKARNLELREASVQNGIDRIDYERRMLTEKKDQYEALKKNFEEKVLNVKESDALKAGRENIRLICENMKPKQAKDEIMQMIDAGEMTEVVSILSSLAPNKQAKIIAEFKSEDDTKKLDEILRLIRQGVPTVPPIRDIREDLKRFNPKNQ